jgi:ubiquinone biosynthesis protein
MVNTGVDLSPQAVEAMALSRRRSDNRLLIGVALLLMFGAWLFR